MKKVLAGEDDVTLASRKEADEVLRQFPDLLDTGDWGWSMIQELLP